MKIASGVAPVPRLLEAGAAVGLGTDGAASNNDLDLWEEVDTAAKLHKVTAMDPTVLDARTAFHMATLGGARAIHMEAEIGSLEVGKRADVVVVGRGAREPAQRAARRVNPPHARQCCIRFIRCATRNASSRACS